MNDDGIVPSEEKRRRIDALTGALIRRQATGDLSFEEMLPGILAAKAGAQRAGFMPLLLEAACIWEAFSSEENFAGWLDPSPWTPDEWSDRVAAFIERLISEEDKAK